MPYYIAKNDSDYLMHHGILGMHWGIRRYQNNDGTLTTAGKVRYGSRGEAKNIQSNLTGLDKASADAQYDYKNSEIKRQKYADKANDARRKGKLTKANELDAKSKEYEKERDSAERRVKSIDERINSVINKAQKDGYDIKMTRITRSPSNLLGKQFVGSLLIGSIPYSVAETVRYRSHGQMSPFSEGFSYNVKPGAGIVTEKRSNLKWH